MDGEADITVFNQDPVGQGKQGGHINPPMEALPSPSESPDGPLVAGYRKWDENKEGHPSCDNA
ncbi:hypothetical protein GCM10007094_31360 [Pseudovibrio japonicus]|uniref:Uncharacterized protein n=1 Tax=Pseudovibrio japonicus TaxID=366534 RepID=A0ABQ3EHE3_9HYPH|nr:hypothetical protein GCM10007094_31360 [Pseudovibrio japonicus]